MTKEGKIKKEINEYLNFLKSKGEPITQESRRAGGFNYKKGIPDKYFTYNGLHIELEVKTPEGERSSMQEKFEEQCIQNGVLYLCATSVENVKEFIKNLKGGRNHYKQVYSTGEEIRINDYCFVLREDILPNKKEIVKIINIDEDVITYVNNVGIPSFTNSGISFLTFIERGRYGRF